MNSEPEHTGHMPCCAIGISTAALYPDYLTEQALEALAGLDFQVVEVFLQADSEYRPAFGLQLDRYRRRLGLQVHSLHLYATYFDLWSPYARTREEARERFRRTLDIASRLQARAITWHGLRYGVDDPDLVAAFLDSLGWACEQAALAGATVCIENVSWCYLRTPEQVAALGETGLPVGFTFDSFQAGESHTDPVALLRAMGERLTTVHLADYASGGPRHLLPGQGLLDWCAILQTLQSIGYNGPLILEPAHITDLAVLNRARAFVAAVLDGISSGDCQDAA